MTKDLLMKILAFVSTAIVAAVGWGIAFQITTNLQTDQRIDDLTTQVTALKQELQSVESQQKAIWRAIGRTR